MMGFALMMNNKKLYLLALTLFLYGTVANGNCDFDDFPVMSEMRVQSVIDDAPSAAGATKVSSTIIPLTRNEIRPNKVIFLFIL